MRVPCRSLSLRHAGDYDAHMSRPAPVTFDTHRFVKRLTEAGMPACQAEVLADEQATLLDTHLATRQDIVPLKQDVTVLKQDVTVLKQDVTVLKQDVTVLKQDVTVLKQDVTVLKQDVAVLKAELIMVKWLVSGVGFGMIALLLKTFWVA